MIYCYCNLTKGRVAIFDFLDIDLINKKWHYKSSGRGRGYACRTISVGGVKQKVMMHRLILERMGHTEYEEADHINGNSLDNRRCNLRPATASQNRQNQLKIGRQYRGVCLRCDGKKWCAYINDRGKTRYLGSYNTPEKAALVYNEAALDVYGEGAFLNDTEKRYSF